MEKEKSPSRNAWIKSLFNGLLAYFLGFAVYMLPGFIVSIKMGFTLGPQSNDPSAVSAEISQTISGMYRESVLLSVLIIVSVSLFIFLAFPECNKKIRRRRDPERAARIRCSGLRDAPVHDRGRFRMDVPTWNSALQRCRVSERGNIKTV